MDELTFKDYVSILKRRWHQILAAFIVLMIIITTVVYFLPPVYRSEGTISIESQDIPEDVAGEKAVARYVDESIDRVKQKVFSRENILSLNEKYSLFPVDENDVSKTLVAFNNIVKITPVTRKMSHSQWDKRQVTVALIVGVEYSDAETAYKLANEIVRQLVAENENVRNKRVAETTTFLTSELERLKSELEVVENKVADYKQKHADSLPEHQGMHMASLEQLRTAIKDLDREYKTVQEELRYLDVELTTTSAGLYENGTNEVGGVSELEQAREELERSLVLYKETHPTIKALKRKVALLEKEQQSSVPGQQTRVTNPAVESAVAKIKAQIESARVRLDSIGNQKRSMNAQIQQLQKQIIQIPQVERGLFTLLRDYDNAKAKYEDVKAKQINAKIAENLERGDKTERFILKQSPEIPKYRKSPKRKQLVLFGLLGALVASVIFAFILEMMDERVRGQAALMSVIERKPLAVVPYIETQTEISKKNKAMKYAYAGLILILSLLIVMAIVHFFITPLDAIVK